MQKLQLFSPWWWATLGHLGLIITAWIFRKRTICILGSMNWNVLWAWSSSSCPNIAHEWNQKFHQNSNGIPKSAGCFDSYFQLSHSATSFGLTGQPGQAGAAGFFNHKHSATWYFKVRNVFTLAEKKVHKRKLEDYGQNMVYLFSDRKMLQKGVGIAHLKASPPPFDRRKKPMNFCQATMWIQIVFVAWKSCDVYCSLWGHRGSYVYQHY